MKARSFPDSKKSRRRLRAPSPEYLGRVAEHYLARFAASEAGVRRVLQNRIRRAAAADPEFAADRQAQSDLEAAIETIIERYRANGILNDVVYAEMKRSGLRRAGKSRNAITRALYGKGIGRELITATLAGEVNESEDRNDIEMTAALKLARRKKIGRFAQGNIDPVIKRRQVAAMARAGFGFDIIKRVFDEDIEPDGNEF